MPRTLLYTIVATLFLAPLMNADASFRTWKDTAGGSIEADLESFDFEDKTIVLVDNSDGKHTVATRSLTTGSRIHLLLSPLFLQAFPDDQGVALQVRVILTLTAFTGVFFLIGFWLAAIFVVHNANPIKAVFGWTGSLAVAAFLFFVYFTTARKFPEYTTELLGAGAVVSFIFAAVFVSAIYQSKIASAFALFVLHFATGILLIIGALHALDVYPLPAAFEAFLNNNVFVSIGLI